MADFQPRFVDLVRNYISTVGTGDFVLGTTVNGYAGFANALQPGDQFYYSAMGIDRPLEREVGRGTLNADMTIGRDPISGTKTPFTAGLKSLSLIAAAEWFTAIQAGAGAAGGGMDAAATRAALAAMTQRQSPAMLGEAGREGLFLFDGSNLSAKVAADPYQGVYVAPASDTTGSSGAWVRKFSGGVEAAWFGFANGAANNAARLESIPAALDPARGAWILLPQGQVAMDRRVVFTRPVKLQGRGKGTNDWATFGSGGTVLVFPQNSTGVRFRHGPGGFNAGSAGAQRATICDLRIAQAALPTTTGTASFDPASPDAISVSSGAANFANDQVVLLEGAGPSVAVQDRAVQISAGSNTATVSVSIKDETGAPVYLGNPGVYVGQPIDIAGAGLPAGTTVTAWGPTSITLSANATVTVANAGYSVRTPIVAEIQSGGGSGTLTIDTPSNAAQAVSNAVLRHAPPGIYATCTITVRDVEVSDASVGLFLRGSTGDQSIADNCGIWDSKFGADFAGVILEGYDAQVNDFYTCNFAGPRVGVLDIGLLGNGFHGCHWAFNVGIMVALPSAQSKIVGGYMESGTSYVAPSGSQCVAVGTNSMHNGSGWSVLDSSMGYLALPFTVLRSGRTLDGFNVGGSKPLRGEGNCNGVPAGRSATGVSLGNDGSNAQAWIYCSTAADALAPARLWSKDLQFYHSDAPGVTMTFRSTGIDLASGKDLRFNGAPVLTGQMPAQADSGAGDVAALKADFNALLTKLRTVKLLASA